MKISDDKKEEVFKRIAELKLENRKFSFILNTLVKEFGFSRNTCWSLFAQWDAARVKLRDLLLDKPK